MKTPFTVSATRTAVDLLDPPDTGAGVLAASRKPGRLSMLLMAILNTGCAGWFAINVSAAHAIGWLAVATLGQIIFLAVPLSAPSPNDVSAVRRALRRHLALVSVLAAAHGSIGFFIFALGNALALALFGMTVYGMAVAFSMFVSQYKRALQAAIMLLMAPAFLMAMFHPHRTSSFFGVVGLAFMVFMLRLVTVRANQSREWKAQPQDYAHASEAMSLADLRTLDVALCDIRLPGPLDGLALAERLQSRHPSLVIAVISAAISPVIENLARQKGWHAL